MVTAKDVQGVMAMMPSFSTEDAGDLSSKNTVDVDNLKIGVDRMINDGIDVITTTGSFGECYNLDWDEYKTLAVAAVDAVKKRVPLFIGATSPNAREVVDRLKFVQDIGGDGTLNGLQPLAERLPVVLAPKTIDNDLGLNYPSEPDEWLRVNDASSKQGYRYNKHPVSNAVFDLDQMVNYVTPGYATAVFVSAQGVGRIRTTAESHRRIAIIEVMGRHSGYLALGTAYGQPDIILIPEHALTTLTYRCA